VESETIPPMFHFRLHWYFLAPAWFVLFHFSLDCFFLTGYGTLCFISYFTVSSLMVSLNASVVHQYRALVASNNTTHAQY
jgi:hypothetical protein